MLSIWAGHEERKERERFTKDLIMGAPGGSGGTKKRGNHD